MFPCHCQRTFGSTAALMQHQTAKRGVCIAAQPTRPPTQPKPSSPPSPPNLRRRSHEAKLFMSGLKPQPIASFDPLTLTPSETPVSSKTPPELICSYNWQSDGGFHVPGHAAIYQPPPLPITLPFDTPTPFLPKHTTPGTTTTTNPFEQALDATAVMSPTFRFTDVDIVTTRNSLRKFLKFCKGSREPFRVNISLVEKTLFVEQFHVRAMVDRGWGRSFERFFARYPAGLEGSTSHDRFLRYGIGGVECVVGFEVDACYEGDDVDQVRSGLGELSIGRASGSGSGSLYGARIMPQSSVAELKTCKPGRNGMATYLPQLWFGRTPWLITGAHVDGKFVKTTVVKVEEQFGAWEAEHQTELRKLAALLQQLREAVRGSRVGKCAAVYERDGDEGALKVYKLSKQGQVVSDEVLQRFWG
ncbi:geranylgeranyl pyrophosphate synthetase [Podospora aff. communis PSN243]|uniref:Geranylgeranyl pyrophosphate synthetase n=1 Tax=Podospora aff. communis PSN243 TaxID=3040156 RepID=A0AAV9GNG3_9PEZI|nr:geranylgeranyl pyrophosphate synthetase [Podospora aff. communis PSN243]